jgi:large subunit ribosomal protein L1
MEKNDFAHALARAKKDSPKRNFTQSVELIINLKNLDLKQPNQQLDQYIKLPHSRGKKTRIGALVGAELIAQAKGACDVAISQDQFAATAADKRKLKKMANEIDYFLAQANIMTDVAKHFGRILGPKGKMPNPKAGCVIPPNANVKTAVERLTDLVRVAAKTQLSAKVLVGKENQPDAEVIDNMHAIYTGVLHALPQEANNIKNVLVKLTMGKPVHVGAPEEMPQ